MVKKPYDTNVKKFPFWTHHKMNGIYLFVTSPEGQRKFKMAPFIMKDRDITLFKRNL